MSSHSTVFVQVLLSAKNVNTALFNLELVRVKSESFSNIKRKQVYIISNYLLIIHVIIILLFPETRKARVKELLLARLCISCIKKKSHVKITLPEK